MRLGKFLFFIIIQIIFSTTLQSRNHYFGNKKSGIIKKEAIKDFNNIANKTIEKAKKMIETDSKEKPNKRIKIILEIEPKHSLKKVKHKLSPFEADISADKEIFADNIMQMCCNYIVEKFNIGFFIVNEERSSKFVSFTGEHKFEKNHKYYTIYFRLEVTKK